MNSRGGQDWRRARGPACSGLSGIMAGADIGHGVAHDRNSRCVTPDLGWSEATCLPNRQAPGGCGSTRHPHLAGGLCGIEARTNDKRGVPVMSGNMKAGVCEQERGRVYGVKASDLVPERLIWSRNLCPYCAHRNCNCLYCSWLSELAERQGFEPWVQFPVHTLSKRARSTAPASLRTLKIHRWRRENPKFAG